MARIVTRRTAPGAIARRETFHNSGKTFRGEWLDRRGRDTFGAWSRLSRETRAAFVEHWTPDREAYVVWSYATPVGIWCDGEWLIPADKFSVTTSNHQAMLRLGAC